MLFDLKFSLYANEKVNIFYDKMDQFSYFLIFSNKKWLVNVDFDCLLLMKVITFNFFYLLSTTKVLSKIYIKKIYMISHVK